MMSVGEVISLLTKAASKFSSEGGDELLMLKEVDCISVGKSDIEVYFTDGNTEDIKIDKDGNVMPKHLWEE